VHNGGWKQQLNLNFYETEHGNFWNRGSTDNAEFESEQDPFANIDAAL